MCVLHPYTYIPLHSLLIASNMSALCSFYTRNLALVLTKKKENKYHEKCSHCYHEPLLSFPAPRPHILILFLQFIFPSKTQKHSTVYNATVQPGPRVEWSTWSNEVKCFCSRNFLLTLQHLTTFNRIPTQSVVGGAQTSSSHVQDSTVEASLNELSNPSTFSASKSSSSSACHYKKG